MNGPVKSAARVLDILEFFCTIDEPIGVTELALRLDIPKSSAQALLLTLARRGYLTRDDSLYRMPEEIKPLWDGGARVRLLGIAEPQMQAMVDETGESAFLGVLTSTLKVQYLAKVSSPNAIRYDASLAPLRPAHCTSIGLAILAYSPRYPFDREILQAFTPHTVVDPEELRRILEAARKAGFAEVRDGHVEGASGVSAPIFGRDGKAIAAVNIGAPTWRYDRNRSHLITVVQDAAARLSTELGAVPGKN